MRYREAGLVSLLVGCSLVNSPSDFQGGDSGAGVDASDDGGIGDAGPRDGALTDARPADAGRTDVGLPDGGPAEVGPADTGVDAGEPVSIVQIEAGSAHACVLLNDGQVICWGDNSEGQLGHEEPIPALVATELSFQSIAVEANITCGVAAGVAHCWGQHYDGIETVGPTDDPVRIGTMRTGTTRVPVCTKRSGNVTCFLSGLSSPSILSELFVDAEAPMGITPADVVLYAAGAQHLVYTTTSNEIRAIGVDWAGQRGDGEQTLDIGIVQLADPEGVEEIVADDERSCVRTPDAVWCWGQVGFPSMGDNRNWVSPVVILNGKLIGGDVVDVDIASSYGCAAANEFVYCWGLFPDPESSPPGIQVPAASLVRSVGGAGARLVATGTDFACSVSDAINVRCWGRNDNDQLGVSELKSGDVANILEDVLTR